MGWGNQQAWFLDIFTKIQISNYDLNEKFKMAVFTKNQKA